MIVAIERAFGSRTAASSGSLLATRIRLLSKDYKPWKMLSLRATVSEANLRLEKAKRKEGNDDPF